MRGRLWAVLFGVALTAVLAFSLGALHFQLDGPARPAQAAAILLACGTALLARRNLRQGWWLLAACLVAFMVWWSGITPRQDRDWAADVAHGVTAEIGADSVLVHHIRDFDWQDRDTAIPRWKSDRYPLDGIASVDLFTSVWGSPAIAHVLVSFGFDDGRHLVFSAEIRREADEAFSSIGGFFRAFELVLIAAEERDIVKLRTHHRAEDVSLFRLRLTRAQARELFLSYLRQGNALAEQPKFYHTVTANCTTVVFRLARLVETGLPFDWRILASGYLPGYLYDLGALDQNVALDQLLSQARITARAQSLPDGADYSTGIRRHP